MRPGLNRRQVEVFPMVSCSVRGKATRRCGCPAAEKPLRAPRETLASLFIVMNKNFWITLFAVALAVNLLGILLLDESTQFISKPLIIIGLAGYFTMATKGTGGGIRMWVWLALFFSWTGDVLLLFQEKKQLFFLLGLSSFLLAHVFYIIFFHGIRIREGIKGKLWLLLIVFIYYLGLVSFLSPYLREMKIPVRIYAVVISFMFMLALHMIYLGNKKAGWLIMTGALLFVISDSVLAINKFYRSFEGAGLIVMFTYGVAQLLIIEGAASYITSVSKQ